jgi:hypothetical protein
VTDKLKAEIDLTKTNVQKLNDEQRKYSKMTEQNLRKMTKIQAENEENQQYYVTELKELQQRLIAHSQSLKMKGKEDRVNESKSKNDEKKMKEDKGKKKNNNMTLKSSSNTEVIDSSAVLKELNMD